MTPDEINAAKLMFAAQTLKRPGDEFAIALKLFPEGQTGPALKAAHEWPNDSLVLAEKERLLAETETGELGFLPTKAEAARKAWDLIDIAPFYEDRLKALKLYADICGYIAKPEAVKIDARVTHNRVMVVPSHGNDADWEDALRKQQANLTAEAAAPNANSTKH